MKRSSRRFYFDAILLDDGKVYLLWEGAPVARIYMNGPHVDSTLVITEP